MPTTPFDAVTRHAVFVERLKAKAVRDILALLDKLGGDLFTQVAASDLEDLTRREVQSLLARLNRTTKAAYGPINGDIETILRDFGAYEGDWQGSMLKRTGLVVDLGVASDSDIWAAVNSQPFEGRFLKDWVAGLEAGTSRRIREAVTQGYADGRSAVEVARDIRGTRSRKGIFDMSRRGAEMVVRTAFTHTATAARSRTYAANPTIKQEQWVAVLDGRTTAICRSRDGKFYDVGEGPRPPAHPNCRSTMVPVTSKNKARLDKRDTYQDWLEAQSPALQDDILGKAKGELFREGGLTVDRFVNRAGQEMTLDQLKAADRAAWDETFGDSGKVQPRKAFTYDKVKAPKNTAELNDFIVNSGIATSGRIKGSAKNYAEPMRAALEVVERFDAPSLDGVGPLSQYGYNGRVGAAAAIANLNYRDGTQKNYLYLPSSFGNAKNAARQFAANDSQRSAYTRASKAGLDRLGVDADPRVVSLFDNRVGSDGISFARAFSIDGPDSQNAIIFHEYGHVLMDIDKKMGPRINSFLADENPRKAGWQYILSRYGGQDDSEFVAESFSYYMAGDREHWRVHPKLLAIFKSGDSLI